ncbi:multidrug effflux MFS transporter [Pseudooceanicola sp. HF7]|uniref:multidrug effflux MFS transporter n=1 Tax=Pseudooceanicola sp. HF7 TaxID=2721560 RepID=UPI00142FF841|nr:multidrug effflux MFS transporter [Pseudooceanicola sp. HF7]NIZ10666.1 multidrug effflux MFS transporter [Pseudooceanicola sp. HF7]
MLRFALVLGVLALTSPLAIDMYLPALPQLASDFGATEAAIQATLIGYFIPFGLAQLFYGPMADATGRRLPLVIGLCIFLIGSIGAAFAPSLPVLVAWRALQGLGGACLMVIPRAVIRDRYTGAEATRLMAMVMLVISISPMLAPLFGTLVLTFGNWRAIFATLALLSLVGLLLTIFMLPETLERPARRKVSVSAMARGAKVLFTDPVFMGLTLVGGFGMASFFVFIASASFVYMSSFGLSEAQFSIAFACNAVGFFAASQVAAGLATRIGMSRMVRLAVTGFFAFTLLLFVIALAGMATVWTMGACLIIANSFLGLVIPTTMVLALDEHGDIAGLASSIGGTLQMVAGGLMIALTGPFFDGTALPMAGAIAVCGLIAFLLATLVLRRREAIA